MGIILVRSSPGGSWSLGDVTKDGVSVTTGLPTGVTVSNGSVTISAAEGKDGYPVRLQAFDNPDANGNTKVVVGIDSASKAPTVTANADGSITTSAITDTSATKLLINYDTEAGTFASLTFVKSTGGVWSFDTTVSTINGVTQTTLPTGVTVNPTTGAVSVADNSIKDGYVTTFLYEGTGGSSLVGVASGTAIDSTLLTSPTVTPNSDGSVSIAAITNADVDTATVNYTNEAGKAVVLQLKKSGANWVFNTTGSTVDGVAITAVPTGVTVNTDGSISIADNAVLDGYAVYERVTDVDGTYQVSSALPNDQPTFATPTATVNSNDGSIHITSIADTEVTKAVVNFVDASFVSQTITLSKSSTGVWSAAAALPVGVTLSSDGSMDFATSALATNYRLNANYFDADGHKVTVDATSPANDTYISTSASDVVTLGTGADTLIYNVLAAADATGGNAKDVWTDFSASEGDKIDVSALLSGQSVAASNIADYLTASYDSATDTTTLKIDRDGTGTTYQATEFLVLTNQSLGLSSADLLNALIYS